MFLHHRFKTQVGIVFDQTNIGINIFTDHWIPLLWHRTRATLPIWNPSSTSSISVLCKLMISLAILPIVLAAIAISLEKLAKRSRETCQVIVGIARPKFLQKSFLTAIPLSKRDAKVPAAPPRLPAK